jgi:hypothetical protein
MLDNITEYQMMKKRSICMEGYPNPTKYKPPAPRTYFGTILAALSLTSSISSISDNGVKLAFSRHSLVNFSKNCELNMFSFCEVMVNLRSESLLVFTLEQKAFLIESYFLKGFKVNGSWIHSIQNCLEEFIVEFPIVIVDRKTFEDNLSRCVKLFRETEGVY